MTNCPAHHSYYLPLAHANQPLSLPHAERFFDPASPQGGDTLLLRTQADNIASRTRPTLPNTPAAAFGSMCASRYEQVCVTLKELHCL